jgi:hypothetical protein
MLLVPKALLVNLELIANSGTTPLEAFILSAVETYIYDACGNNIIENGYDSPKVEIFIHIKTIRKIAREVAFIFSMDRMDAQRAVTNLINDGWFIEKTHLMYFMPHI